MEMSMRGIGETIKNKEQVRSNADNVGTMKYGNGDRYDGDWKEDIKDGKG